MDRELIIEAISNLPSGVKYHSNDGNGNVKFAVNTELIMAIDFTNERTYRYFTKAMNYINSTSKRILVMVPFDDNEAMLLALYQQHSFLSVDDWQELLSQIEALQKVQQ